MKSSKLSVQVNFLQTKSRMEIPVANLHAFITVQGYFRSTHPLKSTVSVSTIVLEFRMLNLIEDDCYYGMSCSVCESYSLI